MATELTEYELQQIRKYIDKFSQIATNVSKKVESNKYTYDISKNEEFLSRFEQEEKSALKSAQKTNDFDYWRNTKKVPTTDKTIF